jgi:alkanesulfonate monooxygenase SsuD/methylene tetrahydromethanopterin reductase-like flavin-dependent oxidoreductase (luciferase family)
VNSRDQPLRTAAGWRRLAADHGYSIRQLVMHLNATREFAGTPGSVADELARYVRAGAIDGLNLIPNGVPGGFDDVVDLLVPELQARGVYPAEYPGTTLRENLGLRAPLAHRALIPG